MDTPRTARFEAALRDAWVVELASWWQQFAHDYLDRELREPRFVILDTETTLGRWDAESRTIGIAASHVRGAPWRVVLETLRHEMAHQYADEVLGGDAVPHGPSFRRACEMLRVSPRATVHGGRTEDRDDAPARTRLLRRIEKLLSLADSPNENEADAAFRKARRLLVEHGLELRGTEPDFSMADLGPLKARHEAWEFTLANILDRFFAVEVVWAHGYDAARAKRGTILRAFGTPTALEMAAYLHTFLTGLLERLWVGYRARRGLRGNRDRRRYYHGVLQGFEQRLAADDARMRDQEGIVPLGDPALAAFVRHHLPRMRTFTRGGTARSRAHVDGESDGRRIVVSKPLAHRAGGGGLLAGP